MSLLDELLIRLGMDASGVEKGAQQADNSLQKVAKSAGNTAGKLMAMVGVTLSVAAVGKVMKDCADEAIKSEEAVTKLESILRATGEAAGQSSKSLQDFAKSAQMTTRFSDEMVMSAQTNLLTFKEIGKDVFPAAEKAMLDLGEKMGSLDSASMVLGKALADPTAAAGLLKRSGVVLGDENEKLIKSFVEMGDVASAQKVILDSLEGSIGGLAEAMGNTAAGKMEILKNSISELKESLGAAFLPMIKKVADVLVKLFNNPAFQKGINKLADIFGKVADAVGGFIEKIAGGDISGAMGVITDFIAQMATDIGNALPTIIPAVVQGILDFANAIIAQLPALVDAGMKLLIGLVQGIINALPVLIGMLPTLINTITSVLSSSAPIIGKAGVEIIVALIGGLFQALPTLIGALPNIVMAIVKGLASLASSFVNVGKNMVEGIWNGFVASWNAFVSKVLKKIQDLVSSIMDKLLMHSPSKVFAGIGKNMALGMQVGYLGNLDFLKTDFLGNATSRITGENLPTSTAGTSIGSGVRIYGNPVFMLPGNISASAIRQAVYP